MWAGQNSRYAMEKGSIWISNNRRKCTLIKYNNDDLLLYVMTKHRQHANAIQVEPNEPVSMMMVKQSTGPLTDEY